MAVDKLRFDDLLAPTLTPGRQRMVDSAESNPVDYTVDSEFAPTRDQVTARFTDYLDEFFPGAE